MSATLPSDPSLGGLAFFSQTPHLTGAPPFALASTLTNALDLLIGYP